MKAPESASTDGTVDGTLARVAKKQVSRRRVVVRGTAATVAGVVAASYIKPSLQGFSFGASTVIGAPTPGQTGGPPPSVTGKCTMQIDVISATCVAATNTITGTLSVKNVTSEKPCPSCTLANPRLVVQEQRSLPSGSGCGQDLGVGVRADRTGSTGGLTSLNPNVAAPNCGETAIYTFSVQYSGTNTQFRLTFLLDVEPSPQHDNVFHACATANC